MHQSLSRKNHWFVLLFIMATHGAVFGQKMWVGPEMGANITPMNSDDLGKNFVVGWYGGGNFEYKFKDWISVRTGIFFTQKQQAYGSTDTSTFSTFGLDTLLAGFANLNTYTSIRGRTSQYYFQIPLMVSFNYKQLGIYGGPYFGYSFASVIKEETISESPWVSAINWSSIDNTGQITAFLPKPYSYNLSTTKGSSTLNPFDFGFKFGLRYQEKRFGVNAGYTIGMLDYRSSKTGSAIRHQSFLVSVNYLFGLNFKKEHKARN